MIDDYTRVERIIEDALGSEPDRAAVERVVLDLRRNVERADEIAHRAMRNNLISVVLYAFLLRAEVSGVSFVGISLANFELLRLLLPLVIAFFYYQMVGAIGTRRLLLSAYDNASYYLNDKVSLLELKDFLRPPTLLGSETLLASLSSPRSNKFWSVLGIPAMLLLLAGPAAAVVFALWANATPLGSGSWPTAVIALPCLVFVARGLFSLRTVHNALN